MAWKVPTLARVVNGWSMNTDTMGVYGNYYLKRAIVAQLGLGANLPEDAIYPLNLGDENGRPLDGASNYTIHFDKEALPPVDAFWSITLYDQEGYQVANSLNRFAVSSWMPFAYNPDGSLDLYFQTREPGRRQGGELAAGADGTVQPDHAPLCPEERCADRQVEPAAGHEGPGAVVPPGPVRPNRRGGRRLSVRCGRVNRNIASSSEATDARRSGLRHRLLAGRSLGRVAARLEVSSRAQMLAWPSALGGRLMA